MPEISIEKLRQSIVDNFLSECVILDTESTGLDPKVAEMCELGICKYRNTAFTNTSLLMGTKEPIPFAASSKNNISRKMLSGLPTFEEQVDKVGKMLEFNNHKYAVAHNNRYDKTLINSHFERHDPAGIETNWLKDINGKDITWICTLKLAKHLIDQSDPRAEVSFALNYLRFALDLDIPENGSVHRAGYDATMCAKLLEFFANYVVNNLVDEETLRNDFDLGEFLVELSAAPYLMKTFPFGKHKGESFEAVPTSYYDWLLKNSDQLQEDNPNFNEDLAHTVSVELTKRFRMG